MDFSKQESWSGLPFPPPGHPPDPGIETASPHSLPRASLGKVIGAGQILLSQAFPGGSDDTESACNAGDPGVIPGQEGPLEKEVAPHSRIPAWRIP